MLTAKLTTVIDSYGGVKQFVPPNPSYIIIGTKNVNSGWLLPKGQEQAFPSSSTAFTVISQKPGTYNTYLGYILGWLDRLKYGHILVSHATPSTVFELSKHNLNWDIFANS